MARTFLVAAARVLVILHSVGVSTPFDLFKRLIPEFIFCFDFANLRSNDELLEILVNFPHNVRTRQQKCFLRCLLRRHDVFLNPLGTLWNWEEAFGFLMSFGYSAGREPYIKSSLFFCVKKKKTLLSEYGCKNAYNFFKCLARHGMSFKADPLFWDFREKYLKENPYGQRSMNQRIHVNVTIPTRKARAGITLAQLEYDEGAMRTDDADNNTAFDFGVDTEGTESPTELTEETGGTDDDLDRDAEGGDEFGDGRKNDTATHLVDNNDAQRDNPLKITPTEPYQRRRGPRGAYQGLKFASNGNRKTITVTIPDIASQANKLTNLKWVDMTNSD